MGIPISIDDKNLQSTACNILNEIDVPCGPEDLEDCHRIKGDCTIVKDYREDVRNSDRIKLFSGFMQLMAFYISKSLNRIVPSQ